MAIHESWWTARRKRQAEIDASIARNADVEFLVDRPVVLKSVVRVAGPFTVDSLSPHRVLSTSEDDPFFLAQLAAAEDEGEIISTTRLVARPAEEEAVDSDDFVRVVLDNLKTAGVGNTKKNERLRFTALRPFPGRYVNAEGRYTEGDTDGAPERKAAIFIGPEYGTVTRAMIVAAAREAADLFDVLVVCGFAFEAHASADTMNLGRLTVLKVNMNQDLRMQQDTVLQHARMYGARPREDLAVTRFYTTGHNFQALRSIHQFDSALRYAFETGAHDRGVAFVVKDQANRVIPCAPNKILVSDIVALRPGGAHLPVGFQTKAKSTLAPIMQKLEKLIPHQKLDAGEIVTIKTEAAIDIITLIQGCFNFEPGYNFDWEACRAAIQYFSTIAPPPAEKGECLILGGTGRRLSRQRAGGRFSDAPHTMQDRAAVRGIVGHQPILVLSQQDGREEDGWRGTPFWWPVLFAPASAAPSVFASTVRDDGAENDDDKEE